MINFITSCFATQCSLILLFRPLLFAFPRPSHFLFLFELLEDELPENDDEEDAAVIAELLLLVNFWLLHDQASKKGWSESAAQQCPYDPA